MFSVMSERRAQFVNQLINGIPMLNLDKADARRDQLLWPFTFLTNRHSLRTNSHSLEFSGKAAHHLLQCPFVF